MLNPIFSLIVAESEYRKGQKKGVDPVFVIEATLQWRALPKFAHEKHRKDPQTVRVKQRASCYWYAGTIAVTTGDFTSNSRSVVSWGDTCCGSVFDRAEIFGDKSVSTFDTLGPLFSYTRS